MSYNNNIISDELIESIFYSLVEEYKTDYKKIFTGLFNFLKESDISNNEIRHTLQDFFILRRQYILMEFGLSYGQIGLFFENLINGDSNDPTSDPPTDTTTDTTTSTTTDTPTDTTNIENQESLPNVNTSTANLQPSFSYQSLFSQHPLSHGEPMIYSIPIQGSNRSLIFTNPYLPNNLEVMEAFANMLDGSSDIQYVYPSFHHPTTHNITHDVAGLSSTLNLALNLFNIVLSPNTPLNVGPMNDVKNVINKEELDKLPTSMYTDIDKEKFKECSICLEEYKSEDKLRILKCDHGFHIDCIDKWLTDCNYKCPVCRDDKNEHHSEV